MKSHSKIFIFVMLVNNAYAISKDSHLKYTGRADATPSIGVVDKPFALPGYFFMEKQLDLFDQQPVEEIEIWKDVPDYEGHYQASTFGRVRSIDRIDYRKNKSEIFTPHKIKGKTLKPKTTNKGYQSIILCKDGVIKHISVHRVVCLTFHEQIIEKPYVNHIDGVKSNNRPANLEWCTPKENSQHAIRTGLQKPILGEKNYNASLTDSQAIEVRERYLSGERAGVLMKEYNISRSRLSELKRLKVYKHLFNKPNNA